MKGYSGIRIRLFCLLVVVFLSVLTVQSFVLLSLTRHEEESMNQYITAQIQGNVEDVEYSLELEERYRKHWSLAFVFLLVNSLVFTVILFFRLDKFFIRPLQKLSRLAEQYRDDDIAGMEFRLRIRQPFFSLAHTLRQMLERIESDRERLQQQVSALEKANDALIASRKQLVRSEKLATVGQLSAGLAHEVGNPLATISGYLDLLQLPDLSTEERREYAGISRDELERVGRLVRELLQFSRTDSLTFQQLSAFRFLQECLELASMHRAVRSCEITLDIEKEGVELSLCPDIMRQIVLNLLLNAATALVSSEQERKKISLTLRLSAAGDEFSLAVEDNGTGVTPDIEAHIFEPFFTTKESGEGTGLGLFVCQLLVERLGGEITAGNRSDGEQGFRVDMVLPTVVCYV